MVKFYEIINGLNIIKKFRKKKLKRIKIYIKYLINNL